MASICLENGRVEQAQLTEQDFEPAEMEESSLTGEELLNALLQNLSTFQEADADVSACNALRLLVVTAQSKAGPNGAIRYTDYMAVAMEQLSKRKEEVDAGDGGSVAHGQGIIVVPLSQLPPGSSKVYKTLMGGTSAAVSGSGASSGGTSGGGSSILGMAMGLWSIARKATGQPSLALKPYFKLWAYKCFMVFNNTNVKLDVHVSATPLIDKLGSLGVNIGSNAVAINAAFEHLRAAGRSSWNMLRPGERAPYMLDGGHVSVVSQANASLGFCVDYWIRAGWKLIVSGIPEPISMRAQPVVE